MVRSQEGKPSKDDDHRSSQKGVNRQEKTLKDFVTKILTWKEL